ncbi:uncharacterized protein PV09_07119 [Verruconis gallopava]|uniref:CSC1/OSCA1-like 7TM region domain-containing protein n=1 Tax=Verruconis gallopava TaxID=253628 RepID=A0A0D1YKF1_9PEZI|nr:uncharacterized protein PV09_07119 [Verruconis gallopava]KIW01347.1 hypothetical protein PV09_07119 [Verruconis gallopava]
MTFHTSVLGDSDDSYGKRIVGEPKDTVLQIGISVVLGSIAFLAFCILRPRWPGMYAARKKSRSAADSLPELPNTLFGWIPMIWRITDAQVLHSAGLDAYVFLAFFKMAIKFLCITLPVALLIIKPVHDRFPEPTGDKHHKNKTETALGNLLHQDLKRNVHNGSDSFVPIPEFDADYLWMYLVFAYLFTFLALYLIIVESKRIIEVRQEWLGAQTTVTDRTIRLSGIPPELRSEDKIKEVIEDLDIGTVESVVMCRDWKELDKTMETRMKVLRRLEEAWTVYLGRRRVERSLETLPIAQPAPPGPAVDPEDREDSTLLPANGANGNSSEVPYARTRPTTRIWYGRFRLRYKVVDAIDYYEEQLRRIDKRIRQLRKKEFKACPLAFVTMNSVATAQMTVQAVLDSHPMQLLANTSPSPADVIWSNTYLSRGQRMFRSWSITAFISILTIFWSVVFVPIAGLIDLNRIHSVFPGLAEALDAHPLAKSLVQTQLSTLGASLLLVLVPYFYWWLSTLQGMISQGDIELSVISKNFFFVFFNFFIVFTALGTAALAPDDFANQTPREIANKLALKIQELRNFYVNYIILQGLGLFPMRLLEFGSVFLYPIGLIGAKTPRDYAEAMQPPMFSYGFYLPQNILIFLICIVYSVLRSSWQVLLPGLLYFIIGYFVHKYQLLYAMDHRQHSTGGSWAMICDRIIVGLIIFQVTMAGQLALRFAIKRSLLIIPLVAMTLWFSYVYSNRYKPLMKFIALRSIRRHEQANQLSSRLLMEQRVRPIDLDEVTDEPAERDMRFINPSLVAPLENVWILDKAARAESIMSRSPPPEEDDPRSLNSAVA